MPATALFRCDAGPAIGLGHLMRSLALAQAWRDAGGRAVFACAGVAEGAERLRAEGMELRSIAAPAGSSQDAAATMSLAGELHAEWLALDGYHFDEGFHRSLAAQAPLLLLDDHARLPSYHAHIVLNHNVYAAPGMYAGKVDGAELLLGLRYALLRREFRLPAELGAAPDIATDIVVTMGGSDPQNVTGHVLAALQQVSAPWQRVTIVLGGGNVHADELRTALAGINLPIRLLHDVQDMRSVLAGSQAAISAGGGTCAELARMGVPMLLGVIAENHAGTVEEFARQSMAVNVGWFQRLSSAELARRVEEFLRDGPLRRQLAQKAQSQVDGRGAERVVAAMLARTPQPARGEAHA